MGSKKITELNESTSPANTDLLVIYDVAGQETKKIQVQNIPTAGLTPLPATGSVDDINQIFGFTRKPTFINVNGSLYPEATGAYAWTWNAGTSEATLAMPVGVGGFIQGVI